MALKSGFFVAALLKTVAANKDAALPLKLFEVSDVILIDESHETGCRNERRLAAVHCSTKSEFEVIHGLLNRVMEVLGVPLEGQALYCLVCSQQHHGASLGSNTSACKPGDTMLSQFIYFPKFMTGISQDSRNLGIARNDKSTTISDII